ncbi:OsmC family protein [Minwuia thermotolerans]|uniref:Osmotically inducible protein OsmC n=1 Tax=Minwuia thermotolerans TaxID=2056226 RepID=A0A2M9G560_9PROT|nr:OsmC family protein [Minwuia thermotolerans]PJK30848.1 osmotically inducible protein OsmC [Minwuia thermotolerans]
MSTDLKTLIAEIQESFRSEPAKALARFESRSRLQDGLRTEATLRQHRVVVDEPEALGGSDAGPNPVELVLAALGTCQEITYRAFASALGIPLEEVSVELEGELDLRGFFAVDDGVPAGYRTIRGTVHLKSSASQEELEKLRQAVNAHCPVLDTLTSPVKVELGLAAENPTRAA